MRFYFKIGGTFLCGILSAAVVYPLLHEAGHFVTAVFVGAKVTGVEVLPTPFVECRFLSSDLIAQFLVGISGITLPYALSMFFNPKQFWLWYISFALKIASVYTAIFSFFSVIFCANGRKLIKNDVAVLLQIFPGGQLFLLVLFAVMSIYGVSVIIKISPLKKCLNFFVK